MRAYQHQGIWLPAVSLNGSSSVRPRCVKDDKASRRPALGPTPASSWWASKAGWHLAVDKVTDGEKGGDARRKTTFFWPNTTTSDTLR